MQHLGALRRRVLRTSRLCAPNTVYDIEVRLRRTADAQMPDRAVLGAGDGPGVARRDGPRRARARRTTAAPRRWWTGGRIPDLMVLHNSTFHNRKPAHSSYVVSKSVRLHDVHTIYLTTFITITWFHAIHYISSAVFTGSGRLAVIQC